MASGVKRQELNLGLNSELENLNYDVKERYEWYTHKYRIPMYGSGAESSVVSVKIL